MRTALESILSEIFRNFIPTKYALMLRIKWETKIGIGKLTCEETYGGSRPLESVEAAALVDYIKKYHPLGFMVNSHQLFAN